VTEGWAARHGGVGVAVLLSDGGMGGAMQRRVRGEEGEGTDGGWPWRHLGHGQGQRGWAAKGVGGGHVRKTRGRQPHTSANAGPTRIPNEDI
jgi:hypothetical protein